MRFRHLILLALALSLPVAAQTEVSVGTAVQGTDNMGQSGTQAAFGLGARKALGLFDLSAAVKRAELEKVGTPGGHQWTISGDIRHWVGPNLFLVVGGHRILSDATVWTKKTSWVDGGIGLCARYGTTATRRPHRDEFSVRYGGEVGTDAEAPNHTQGWAFLWSHDLPLRGSAFLRGSVGTSSRKYLQDGAWRHGTSSSLGIAFVLRPQDL
ncbi:MAG: hypothetical protein IT406_03740 [Candidatus Yanofskybacteria bacterium]|nr:hypothetical protein [Candidatus Yanofskybacteria bacterium]